MRIWISFIDKPRPVGLVPELVPKVFRHVLERASDLRFWSNWKPFIDLDNTPGMS